MRKSLTVFLLLLVVLSQDVMAVEEPPYQVLLNEPPFEHRRYPGFVVAETELAGDFDSASRSGFRRVAGYIFGDNRLASGESRKIAMTAPVTVSPKNDGWRLHFVMPGTEAMESLPRPNNPDVNLRKVAEHDMVAIRFSGFTTEGSIAQATEKLKAWASEKGLVLKGEPQIARYNDPFTLPWRRRNEILIEVSPAR